MWGSRLLAFGCILAVSACHDPTMSTSDGISPSAGLAQRHNARVHIINPYAGDGPGPNPGGSGARAASVIERYEAGMDQADAEPVAE